MKVFLSWSGVRSQAVAKVFNEWLPSVCHGASTWISTDDIAKGADWVTSIREALKDSNGVGLFFVTRPALSSQWFLFEAGSIAMLGHGRVCLVMVDQLPDGAMHPPLSAYQSTRMDHDDVLLLVKTLNEKCLSPMPEAALVKSFERAWPELEGLVRGAVEANPDPTGGPQQLSSDERLSEISEAAARIEARLNNLETRDTQSPFAPEIDRLLGPFVPLVALERTFLLPRIQEFEECWQTGEIRSNEEELRLERDMLRCLAYGASKNITAAILKALGHLFVKRYGSLVGPS